MTAVAIESEPRIEAAARQLAWWPIAMIGLAALGFSMGVLVIDGAPVGVFADDAFYVILARSIAEGHGIRFLNLPGSPAATHFPPGYPLALAALWRMAPTFPANLIVFKAFNALCLAVITPGVARYARIRLGDPRLAIAAGVVTAVSMPLLILGSMLLSELFFLTLLVLLLPEVERAVEEPISPGRLAGLGAAIALCALVRTHGIVLIPASAVVLLVRRRWRDAATVGGVAIACLLPWQLWSARHGGTLPAPLLGQYDSYTRWWMQGYHSMGPRILALTLGKTVDESLGMFAVLFSPMRGTFAHAATLLLLGGMMALGARAEWRRIPVTLLFLAGYLVIVLLWPGAPSRFLWGIWPLFLLLLAAGARAAWQASLASRPVRRAVVAAAAAWLVVGYAAYEARGFRGRWWSSIARGSTRRIEGAVQWTLGHTTPADLVAADDDGTIFLYTGRRTVPARSFTTAQYLTGRPSSPSEDLSSILDAYPVRAVVVGTAGSYEAAASLAVPPRPRLSSGEEYPGGAAFTVLPR
ncbi:MAG: hypothetical protein M3Z10_00335 [Gemmatimonadota bacterium]|nr:hypothetical protein [Gemmatimonadota bacterium]